ncbi:MAG: Rv1355c family protein [Flavipsychrobacter sp.]|nr:Rv1355c family protein [Flavipsychrobacter sp.]
MNRDINHGLFQWQYQPVFFRLHLPTDKAAYQQLLQEHSHLSVHDEMEGQLRELIKSLHPSRKIPAQEYPGLIAAHLDGCPMQEYGVWVYYPWLNSVVHLLDEEEFVEVRTNRNRYKITREEQQQLATRRIGVVGLSVGQSIALTLAMERTCGELRLADFDTAELSNLNRIRTGVKNLGLPKTIIAAREIAELDPYIKVTLYNDGLTKEILDSYFTGGGNLDLLVEVCDGLDVKILSRYKARELRIPVVMDTNDRGMLDVERFDLEPDRKILHGLAGDLDPEKLQSLSNEDKIPYILQMVGAEDISPRLKASMIEVEQSINTWPQLASSVTLGGAITTDVCRRILLDQYKGSGRFYVDIEDIVKDEAAHTEENYDGPAKLTEQEMLQIAAQVQPAEGAERLTEDDARRLVEAGTKAPTGGNCQPWFYIYRDETLFVFHDLHYSYSLLDYDNLGSYFAIGAAVENISVQAATNGLRAETNYFPVEGNRKLVAMVRFYKDAAVATEENTSLATAIDLRVTNRELSTRELLSPGVYTELRKVIAPIDGAALHVFDDEPTMTELAGMLATTEMLRIIHPRGHYDTFRKELRWTNEEILQTRDGLDVRTLGATSTEIAALKVADDAEAIAFLRSIKGGAAFRKAVMKSVASASCMCILTLPANTYGHFAEGGRAVERMWLTANRLGVAFQPISQLVFFMERLQRGGDGELDEFFKAEFVKLRNKFYTLLPQMSGLHPIFIFRLSKADMPKVRSLRRAVESVFIYS